MIYAQVKIDEKAGWRNMVRDNTFPLIFKDALVGVYSVLARHDRVKSADVRNE